MHGLGFVDPGIIINSSIYMVMVSCRLATIFQPDEDIEKKVYDLDQSKFKVPMCSMYCKGQGMYVCIKRTIVEVKVCMYG